MKLTDITPKSFDCGIGGCPALFETGHGTYVLIGKRLSGGDAQQLAARTGSDEIAIEIPGELLSNLRR